MKKFLLTGATGMDGSHMIDLLLKETDLEIHGIVRRSSRGYGALENIKHLVNDPSIYRKRLFLHIGDLADASSLTRIFQEVKPDYIFNAGAQADVAESFYQPEYTFDVTGIGVIRMLEAMRRYCPDARFIQASTSELYGKCLTEPQNEETPLNPQSPYAVAKYMGYQTVKNYREGYKLFASNSIAFNHAGPRRTDEYLDAKVAKAVARIKLGLQKELRLGNLESWRDWSSAEDIVRGIWLALQHDKPDDFVFGTGTKAQVKEWVEACFEHVGLKSKDYIISDPALFRPNEVDSLLADSSKAERELGWKPTMDWRGLVKVMVDHYLVEAEKEKRLLV